MALETISAVQPGISLPQSVRSMRRRRFVRHGIEFVAPRMLFVRLGNGFVALRTGFVAPRMPFVRPGTGLVRLRMELVRPRTESVTRWGRGVRHQSPGAGLLEGCEGVRFWSVPQATGRRRVQAHGRRPARTSAGRRRACGTAPGADDGKGSAGCRQGATERALLLDLGRDVDLDPRVRAVLARLHFGADLPRVVLQNQTQKLVGGGFCKRWHRRGIGSLPDGGPATKERYTVSGFGAGRASDWRRSWRSWVLSKNT